MINYTLLNIKSGLKNNYTGFGKKDVIDDLRWAYDELQKFEQFKRENTLYDNNQQLELCVKQRDEIIEKQDMKIKQLEKLVDSLQKGNVVEQIHMNRSLQFRFKGREARLTESQTASGVN